jgi:hypothetical protein
MLNLADGEKIGPFGYGLGLKEKTRAFEARAFKRISNRN